MATLREIRRQLHSVENIKKITQAMEMVAASRLRKAQAKAEMSRRYSRKLQEILHQLVMVARDFEHPLVEERRVKKRGFVVVAGDRGLCGGYNQMVFSTTEKLLKQYHPEQVELILIGRKAIDYFSGKKWKIGEKIPEWGGKIHYPEIEKFTQHLIHQYLVGKLDEVWLIYTHFINVAARKVVVEKLLNIERGQLEEKITPPSYILEPDAEHIFAEILPRYCATKIQSALNEAYASELSARIFSMRAATKNAEEMIISLTLIRNKIRQTGITRELIEITSCVESLK
jgi:F-type H+-transporting ATPase subunit gamma